MKTEVRRHYNHIAKIYDKLKNKNQYYYNDMKNFLSSHIPPGSNVLEIGCGTGELLNHVQPALGLGIDLSERMVEIARNKYPHLQFKAGEAENLNSDRKFQYIMMIDLLGHVHDIWEILQSLESAVSENTVLCIATRNPDWQPIFTLAEKLKLKTPEGPHNFMRMSDIANLLKIFDYEVVRKEMRLFVPKRIPLIADILNAIIPRIPFLQNYCAVQTIVVRKTIPSPVTEYHCSVIVPCHNEEGNVERCAETVQQMGLGTELIFVDDGSTDSTLRKLREIETRHAHVKVVSFPKNQGKGKAVQAGFHAASGEVLMILDADLTVPAHDLHEFYYVLARHKGRFVNGSRHVYPLEDQSMRQLNLWGNQFFAMIMSWILSNEVTDTLCGTKALFKEDFLKMQMGSDRWGDYDLLFGAADLKLKIVEIPIHYLKRMAGQSKMKTFQHACLLAQICVRGALRYKIFPRHFLKH